MDTVNCILCSSVILQANLEPSSWLGPVPELPVTCFMRLLRGEVKEESGLDSTSLSDSAYFRFCLNCTNKIATVQAMHIELENIQTKLAEFKYEFEEELIRSNRKNTDPPWSRSTTLRFKIIREFGLDSVPAFHTATVAPDIPVDLMSECEMSEGDEDNYKEDSFEAEDFDSAKFSPAFDYEAAPRKEDRFARQNASQSQPKVQTVQLKPCSIQLGCRVDDPPPANTSRMLRCKKRVLRDYDNFPQKCPVAGCISKATFNNIYKYRRHMSFHEKPKPQSPLIPRYVGFPKRCQLPGCKNPTMYRNHHKLQRHMKSHALAKIREASNPIIAEADGLTYPAKCPIPNCSSESEYKDRNSLRRHLRKVHMEDNRQRLTNDELESQLNSCVLPTKCPIPDCDSKLEFNTRDELKCHLCVGHLIVQKARKHSNPNPLYLEIQDIVYPARCPRRGCKRDQLFENRESLRTHLKHVHSPNKKSRTLPEDEASELHTCSICNASFLSAVSLRYHAKIHENPVINWTCEDCGAGFKTVMGLKDHRLANHEPNLTPLLCTQCPKTFKTRIRLEIHMKRHDGDNKYFCRACPKGFMSHYLKVDHERFAHWQELGLEQIKCHICSKTYNRNRTLQIHMQTHTGTQKYSCTECDYKTGRHNDLREHVATVHQPDFPFPCNLCDKKFKLERRLRQHLLEHDPEAKTACEFCGKRFMTLRSLRIHREKKHGAQLPSRDFKNGFIAELA